MVSLSRPDFRDEFCTSDPSEQGILLQRLLRRPELEVPCQETPDRESGNLLDQWQPGGWGWNWIGIKLGVPYPLETNLKNHDLC